MKRVRDPDFFIKQKNCEKQFESHVTKKKGKKEKKRDSRIFLDQEDYGPLGGGLFERGAELLYKVLYESKLKTKDQNTLNEAMEEWERKKVKNPCYFAAMVQEQIAGCDRKSHKVRLGALKLAFADLLMELNGVDEIHLISASNFHLKSDKIKYSVKLEELLPPSFPTDYDKDMPDYHYKKMVAEWKKTVKEWEKVNSKEFRQEHMKDWAKLNFLNFTLTPHTPDLMVRFAVCITEAARLQRIAK